MMKSSFKINSKTNLKINNKAKFIFAVALVSLLVMFIAAIFIHKEKNYDDAISQSMKLYMLSYKIANSADEVELEQLQDQVTNAKEITAKLMHQNTKLKQPFDSLFSSIDGIYSQKQLALTKQVVFTAEDPSDLLVKVQEVHLQIGKLVGDQDIEHLIPALFGENGVTIKSGMESAYYETQKLGRMMGLVEAIIWEHEETKAIPNRKMYL